MRESAAPGASGAIAVDSHPHARGLPQTLWMTVNPATPLPLTLEPESPENV